MLEDRRTVKALTLVLCLIYIAVRLWRLTDSCLWFDEIFSVHAAEHDLGALFQFVAQDLIHPPLFYVLLKVWISIGGESLTWLRLFPVVLSTFALFPFIYLCRELKLRPAAMLLALSFLAVNGSLIKYAQEVRMYALLLFLSVVSTWLFARFYFRGKNIWLLTLVNVLLIYTHYFGWFVVASEVAAIFIFQRVKIRHVLIMSGIALVAFIPWIVAVLKAANAGADVKQNIGWMERPGLREMFRFAFDAIEPFYYQQSSGDASTILFITIPLLLTIGAAKVLMFMGWKQKEDKRPIYLMGLFVAVPVVFAFVISWLAPVSIWGSRHLIIVFAPMAILIGMMLNAISDKRVRYVGIALVILLMIAAFAIRLTTPTVEYVWCTWEQLAVRITSDEKQTIYAFEDLTAYHLWFATRTRGNVEVIKVDNLPGLSEDKAYFLPRGFDGVRRMDISTDPDPRIWLAFRDDKWRDNHEPLAYFLGSGYSVFQRHDIATPTGTGFLVEARK